MKILLLICFCLGPLFSQNFQPLPNNVFRISIDQGSSKYFWDRGQQQFSLEGIGKMYFDPFTHNDSLRFSSNFDLYHSGSLYIDKIAVNQDTLSIASTVEGWMKQLNSDFNLNLPDFGQQNIDTNIFRYPEGSFLEKRSKKIIAKTLRIDYGFSNEVTFNISIPFIELFSINQSFSKVSVSSIQGVQPLVDYHQNAKSVLKNFIDSESFLDLPGDSLEKIIQFIYDLYYSRDGEFSVSWIQHAQNDPLGNDLVDKRFIPSDMGTEEGDYVSLDSLANWYYPSTKSGNGLGDIDIGLNILLKGDPPWSSDKSTESIYGQLFLSIPFGRTLSSFKNSFIDENTKYNQLNEAVFGKGVYRWTIGFLGVRYLKGRNMARVYYQGQYKFSLATTLNTPIRFFSGGHTNSDSILHSVGNTYKYDMGDGLFIRAGGEYEIFRNRVRIIGELSSNYQGMDNYLSKSTYWDKWMEEQTGVISNLDIKMELWFLNSISSNRIGPFSFDAYVGYRERLIANNTFKGSGFYIGFSTFFQGW